MMFYVWYIVNLNRYTPQLCCGGSFISGDNQPHNRIHFKSKGN